MCCHCQSPQMSRRDFMTSSALGLAGATLLSPLAFAASAQEWDPAQPIVPLGKKLSVQPALLYQFYKPQKARSWRPWGGLHNESDLDAEVNRIHAELKQLEQQADFPVEILPLAKINSQETAHQFSTATNYDVPIVYAASGGGNMLEACFSENRNNLIFLRHRSGPIYLWYEIIHNRFLRKGGQAFELDGYRYPAGMTIHDVVVDDCQELLNKLKVLYGVQNFRGQRIVALGGSGGWCCPPAPEVAREKFKIDIQSVSYEDLGQRIQSARADKKRIKQAQQWTDKYLSLPETSLNTEKHFVINAFLLYGIFKDLLREHQTNAFTINECMGTVIPMAETTACLPLSLLNDEGLVAFCESDFNVIPAGILLYYLSGKPVFLNDPTFPHHGMVTAAHCTAPRRLEGQNYARANVVTHFESDYGATPKVELPLGTKISMICPDCRQQEWLGFTGTIEANPFYDICRSQYDIRIDGNWKKLLEDHRGFHWMMACGDYMSEMEYAAEKIGVSWMNISQSV